ncbi:uncharacterized protein LOC126621231 [Malus sylvestris]|uniref:uncharacterized protein LOC126621231 n=1 Tax=Malus sylvestris TaxID=3752 RepID=UPI0021ACB110|nr:uncharacterized protein LOC126621231 [Malus sylvestris]
MGHLPSDALGTGRTDSKEGEKTSITQKGIKKIKEDGRSRVQEGGLGLKARGQSQELKGGRYSLKREQSQLCRSTTQHTLNGSGKVSTNWNQMAAQEIEELVVNLERNMDLSMMEQGIKLVGMALVNKNLNKWGIRNILRSSWKEYGEIDVEWVKNNTFIITVPDKSTATKILNQVPWVVMKQNFSVKRWNQELALEEINMYKVLFWIQIRGVPLYFISENNVRRLAAKIGEFVELKDTAKARGFLRVKVAVNTSNPLTTGCWLPRTNEKESWIEFRYERLQDFCYKCGRIGHSNIECSYEAVKGGMAGYGEWTKAAPVRDFINFPRPMAINGGERRHAGATRMGSRIEEIPEDDPAQSEGVVTMQKFVPQPYQLQRCMEICGEGGVKAVQVQGISSNNKRELDGLDKEGGQSSMKKVRIEKDTVQAKDLMAKQTGSSSRETKMKDHRIVGVRRRMGYCNGFDVAPVGRAGDLQCVFRFTRVYGTSYSSEKVDFWRGMIQNFGSDDTQWTCGGDFNEFLWDHEKSGGAEVRYNRTRYLEEFMSKLEILDLGYNGLKFTWRGKRNGQLVEARLDRALGNENWQVLWPNYLVSIGTTLGSDHNPVLVHCAPKEGNSVERWNKKICDCRARLLRWSGRKFSQRRWKIQEMMSQLGRLQMDWRSNSQEIEGLSKAVDTLWSQEECVWKQKSRVQWLQEGDANTKFFHQSTLQRRRRNKVVTLKNDNEEWVDNPDQVRRLFDEHFMALFSSSGHRDWGGILDCVIPKVSEEMNATLSAPVSADEIKQAALNMGGLKAPGPDGFQGIFYRSQWDIITADVNKMIEDLMAGSLQPLRINATHLALIPKVPNPESVSHFRPISLCNFSYKILSKVLANRLKRFLQDLISPTQNAFVEGRQIQDNIGIAHELFHFLKTRKTKCKLELGIKLDMHKAYDRVEWDFLLAVMEKMGFDSRWRNLILRCISTVSFAILLNGQPGPRFAPSRGLRQGDPLSPYLFLLVSEVLSLLIKQAGERKQIEGVKMGLAGPMISHIFFADDTLIFMKADERNCRNLVQLAAILGMEIVGDPGLYLGVPAIWGKSKKNGLAYIKGRLLGKIQGWKCSTLSQAGREILIKAVAQAIPAYPMNLFKFPSTLCNELDALISKFWWGQKEGENRIHWVSKEILGRSKQDGGLGLRCFIDFNDAFLAKQCWRLLSEPNSLWAMVLKARYFPNCSLLDAKRGGRASWAWSSLLVGRDIILEGAHWQIMNGTEVRVWVDRWLPSIPSGRPSPLGTVQVSRNLRVNSLICNESGDWEVDFLKPFVVEEEIKAILEIPLGDPTLKDRLVWPFEKKGAYSVKSGYHWAVSRTHIHKNVNPHRSDMIPTQLWKCMWSLEVPQKIRVFMWKSLHAAVATMANLFFRRSSLSPMCLLCNSAEESMEHLFLQCPWVEAVWNGGSMTRGIGRVGFFSWQPIYPGQVIAAVHHSVGMFQKANRVPSNRPRIIDLDRGNAVSWSPPGAGFIKINVDASWNARECVGFVGVVARDDYGRFVAACRKNISALSVALAEAKAILHGVSLGRSMG